MRVKPSVTIEQVLSWGALWALLAAGLAHGGEIVLQKSSGGLVVLPDSLRADGADRDSKEVEQLREATRDLARYLSEVCGAEVTIGKDQKDFPGIAIHIGRTDFVAEQKLDLESLDLEGFVIKGEGKNVLLAGRTLLGTRHAIYSFLERYCGVRWYFPGELGTFVPRRERIVLKDLNDRENPAFLARYFTVHGKDEARRWERRNKLQDHWTVRLKGNSHSMASVIPARTYGAEHPEYFALRDGKRNVPQDSRRELRAAYCLTNPEVIDICAQWIIRHFDRRPEATSVSMAMNDTTRYCQCERCEAEGVRGTTDGPNYADRYFTFVNRVARKVKPKHPDELIGVLAYGGARVLPNRLKRLEDNINVYLVAGGPGYSHLESYRKPREDLIRGWSAFTGNLCVYGYQFGTSESRFLQIPTFYPHLVAEDLRFLDRAGVKGSVTEMLPFWAFSPRPWLMAGLLWNPELSVDRLLGECCASMFGEAASDVRRYFGLLEEAWLGQKEIRRISSSDAQYEIMEPYFGRLDAVLGSALRKATGGKEKARVKFFADGFSATRLFAKSCEIARSYPLFPATTEELFAALKGALRLYENEKAIEEHRTLLEEKYGIDRGVIAPREKSDLVRRTLERCAAWFDRHGLKDEADLVRKGPAAIFGREELVAAQKAADRELAVAAGLEEEGTDEDEESGAEEDGLKQVLDREQALIAGLEERGVGLRPRPTMLVRYVDRTEAALAKGAKLLLRAPFEDGTEMAKSGATTSGKLVFERGLSGRAVFLREKHSLISLPLTKLNARSGTIEFFVKTRWTGRTGPFRTNLVCTGGNYDPPGHLSISIGGEGETRTLAFTLYFVGGNNYVRIPLRSWQEDAWYHVAAMWRIDPDDPERNRIALYLNGKAGEARFSMGKAQDIRPTGPLGIGNRPVSYQFMDYPVLLLDELRIYDRPIPAKALSFAPASQ